TCFFPSGKKALGHTPCSDDEYTACCDNNHVCMTNGLCVNVGSDQPYGFSRAACTDKSWGSSCPQECVEKEDGKAGCAILTFEAGGNATTYCCNAITSKNGSAACANDEDPFTITSGTAISGRAYLSNLVAKDSGNNNREVAIGAGVGVPLGVLFLTALGWALYERKKR
ncbi:uncharacterized protein EURHEDRAFT_434047, partial [Aspergillus ruber CBS 135680]